MPVIDVNGVALNYREMGNRDQRTIVFTHLVGLWDSEVFDHLMTELEDDFHIVTVDQHGHGQSGYRTPLTLEEMTADYYQLLTKLGLSNVIWVGYSIGGMIGMRLALKHPETIDSLILIATTARLDPLPLREKTGQLWEMFRDGHGETIADAALRFFFAPATYKNQPQLIEHARYNLISHQNVAGVFEAARAALHRTDISDQIHAINVPTLVIAGKDDVTATPAEAELMVSRIPHAQLAVVDEASHLIVIEKPREVARLIGEFLQGVKSGLYSSSRKDKAHVKVNPWSNHLITQ